MQKGDVLILPPGAMHGSQIPTGCYECVIFEINALFSASSLHFRALQNFWEEMGLQPVYLSSDNPSVTIANSFFDAVSKKVTKASILSACGNLLALFGSVQASIKPSDIAKNTANQVQIERIKKVIIYMKKNYQNPITLTELAAVADLNREYLCRSFRQVVGKSPIRFLIEYRVECSKKILLSPTGSVTDAALSSGFSDLSYYIRKFSELCGVTPMQYRKHELGIQ